VQAQTDVSLRETLLSWRNPDGGWAYAPGKRSRLEPTCLALLALGRAHGELASVIERWPKRGGFLVDGDALPPNYGFNGIALMTALTVSSSEALRIGIAKALLGAKGIKFEEQSDALGQDNRLQAWSWVDRTFSWVEPTAWCLLALKKWAGRARATEVKSRVDEAERLLFDRMCASGGWNYGNPRVFDAKLHAYVPTTALGLLALQDRRSHPALAKSLDFLAGHARSEGSTSALALATIALAVLGRPDQRLRDLIPTGAALATELTQIAAVALGAYALDNDDGYAAFRV
jgi:hypothetical protein